MPPSCKFHARKISGYLVEPLQDGHWAGWQNHHATNPCCVRLSGDARVFLGYRAGGQADYYNIAGTDVWGSHLGLAILGEHGEQIVHRLPLPIMTIERDVALPQTAEEYDAYETGPDRDRIVLLHDFRFWEDRGWLHVIHHEASIVRVFDCIVRMKVETFLAKIETSLALLGSPQEELREAWRRIWWASGVWQPCGVGGTSRIYSSEATKNDIVFMRLKTGKRFFRDYSG